MKGFVIRIIPPESENSKAHFLFWQLSRLNLSDLLLRLKLGADDVLDGVKGQKSNLSHPLEVAGDLELLDEAGHHHAQGRPPPDQSALSFLSVLTKKVDFTWGKDLFLNFS